jgi:oxygen-dependent protoporphyrinogen oxidase
VTVLEQEDHAGGRAHTELADGYAIDVGAGFLASFYTHTLRLVDELGLERVPIRGGSHIFSADGPHLIRFGPGSTLLPPRGRWRLAKTVFKLLRNWPRVDVHALAKAHALDTESVAEYARRELGTDLLENIVEPVLSGVCYWSPERTSAAMFLVLLKAGIGLRRFTVRQGIGELCRRMASDVDLRLETEVCRVTGDPGTGYVVTARRAGTEQSFPADGVLCATPATAIPSLFPGLPEPERAFFGNVSYSATVAVALALSRRRSRMPDNVFFSRGEGQPRYLAAVTSLAARNPAQVPPGQELLRLFANGRTAHQLLQKSDAEIRNALVNDLMLTGLDVTPVSDELFYRVYRWPQAVPEFDVGSFKRLKERADSNGLWGRVAFAGDYLGGPSIEGAASSGVRAARELSASLAGPRAKRARGLSP